MLFHQQHKEISEANHQKATINSESSAMDSAFDEHSGLAAATAPSLNLKASSIQNSAVQLQDQTPTQGGTSIQTPGIVSWDGSPVLRLRSSRSTSSDDNISGFLPFNQRVNVLREFAGDWYYVETDNGLSGYVAKQYVNTDMPESDARLHRVESGANGFAINIARQYFGGAISDDHG